MWKPCTFPQSEGRKVSIFWCLDSTRDFAHPLWLSYALSCSRRRQMPSRLPQLAGLSLEPVYQQGYLTASAAPEASDSPSGWEGCQQCPWKERQTQWEIERTKKIYTHTHTHTMESEGIRIQRQEWQPRFRASTLVTKINPIIFWRKGIARCLWWYLLWDWHVSGRAPGYERTSGIIYSSPLVKYF